MVPTDGVFIHSCCPQRGTAAAPKSSRGLSLTVLFMFCCTVSAFSLTEALRKILSAKKALTPETFDIRMG